MISHIAVDINKMRTVRGSGPTTADIVILGEAPGEDEVRKSVPFVGPSGRELRNRLFTAGIDESKIRFENVVEYKLENNDISILYQDKKHLIPTPELADWFDDARRRIRGLNPKVIVACGETALQAVTGLSGIGANQCARCEGIRELDRIPVIPVYHPATILRMPAFGPWLLFGLKKARRLAEGHKDEPRELITNSTVEQVISFLETCSESAHYAFDIEIFRNELTCISFAIRNMKTDGTITSMSIPLSRAGGSYWTSTDERTILLKIAETLSAERPLKIIQNYIFESLCLSRLGIEISLPIFDTMLASNILHAELPKGLGDLAKLYTYAPPWKDKHDWSAKIDPEALYRYNAMDSAITLEVYEKQIKEMEERGLSASYDQRITRYIEPVYRMCATGWNVDHEALSKLNAEIKTKLMPLREAIQKEADHYGIVDFNPGSHHQVKKLIKAMGISVPTKDQKETSDVKHLMKLARRYPSNTIFPKLVEFSGINKLNTTYGSVELDPDKRLRFSINIGGTKSGRFSSSQTPWGTGLNSQNIPSEFRHIVIPDSGMKLIQIDLSQAEARVVSWLAKEESMSKIFDEGGDIHSKVASLIFRRDITALPPDEYKRLRYLGKKSVHAFNYGMAEAKFADVCLEEAGISISVEEARRLKNAYFSSFSRLPLWHLSVQNEIRRTRRLTTPFGRERAFHGRLDDELFRDGYSYVPQSTVADCLNESWMALESHNESKLIQVIQQGHDSILCQTPAENVPAALHIIVASFQSVSFKVHNVDRSIPFDIAIGSNWRDMEKYDISKIVRSSAEPISSHSIEVRL